MATPEMKSTIEGIHYVVHITVEEIVVTKNEPVYRGGTTAETRDRKVNELGKIILKDKIMTNLIAKAKQALDIIPE